jgi:hypothetical protein
MFIKISESLDPIQLEKLESVAPQVDNEMLNAHFKSFASDLKKIAPKANDFLYFSAVMMHAAEASALNEDGSPRLNRYGKPVEVGWDKKGESWKWKSNDPSILAYKNANGDIFPEEELTKAYRKWVGKPLCIDHKSSSVDHVRGFIVDTYYDRKLKRVVALCALDRHNYPDLARKVETGYSTSVSMGTAVGRAICYDCGKVARVEQDFCSHMRSKSCYGEINLDLNPIELSIVVNGADPQAKIKHIVAAANTLSSYVALKEKEFNKISKNSGNNTELMSLRHDLEQALNKIAQLESSINDDNGEELIDLIKEAQENSQLSEEKVSNDLQESNDVTLSDPQQVLSAVGVKINNMLTVMSDMKQSLELATNSIKKEENMSGSKDKQKRLFPGHCRARARRSSVRSRCFEHESSF